MQDNFHPLSLPETLALSVRRVQQFNTEIVAAASGFEARNARYDGARRHYILESGPVPLAVGQQLTAFFEARRGRQFGFLLRDWMDFHTGSDAPQAGDETLRALDREGQNFALVKTYEDEARMVTRRIFKPLRHDFQLALNGTRLQSDRDFILDETRGTVQLQRQQVNNVDLTAGFFFHVPVRFDSDRLEVERLEGDMVRIRPLSLIELMLAD